MEIFTIGFTKKSAAEFFGSLRRVGTRRVIDVRLNNRSQLAGFSKQEDLRYFLVEICGADYLHLPILAPTEEMLRGYREGSISWDDYERQFSNLLKDRGVDHQVDRRMFEEPTVLLCSEDQPDRCHRRLVAEYLRGLWGGVEITHL